MIVLRDREREEERTLPASESLTAASTDWYDTVLCAFNNLEWHVFSNVSICLQQHSWFHELTKLKSTVVSMPGGTESERENQSLCASFKLLVSVATGRVVDDSVFIFAANFQIMCSGTYRGEHSIKLYVIESRITHADMLIHESKPYGMCSVCVCICV